MTDIKTVQVQQMADEYHDLVDCIKVGQKIDLDEYLEDHDLENLTTCGQVLYEFFEHHKHIMEQHAAMHKAMKALLAICMTHAPADEAENVRRIGLMFMRILPITIGSRVRHTEEKATGTLKGTENGKPVVRWDRNDGSNTPVTGRMASWDLLEAIP